MMQLFKSIGNNISLITYHFYTWLFRFVVIYIAMIPLNNQMNAFFNARTINENMISNLDVHALFEFIYKGFYDQSGFSYGVLISLLFMYSLFQLIIDPLIEAGFIGALASKDKTKFWPSLKSKGLKLILLKLLLLIPNLILIAVALFSVFIIGSPSYDLLNLFIAFIIVGTFFLFIYKLNDLAKYHLMIKEKNITDALSFGFSNVFTQFKNTLVLNIVTVIIFYLGFSCSSLIDKSYEVTTTGAITIMLLFQQIFIFLKQVLRYSYLDAIMQMSINLEKPEEVIDTNSDDSASLEATT